MKFYLKIDKHCQLFEFSDPMQNHGPNDFPENESLPQDEHKEKPVHEPIPRILVISGSFLITAAIIIIFAGLRAAQSIVAPFFLACFLAIVLTAPLRWLKSKGFSDLGASLIVIVGVLIGGFSIIWILSGSVNKFLARIPEYTVKFNESIASIDDLLEPHGMSLLGGPKENKHKNGAGDTNGASGFSTSPLDETSPGETAPSPQNEPETEPNDSSGPAEKPALKPATGQEEILMHPLSIEPMTAEDHAAINTVGVAGYIRWGASELAKLATICFIVMILVVFMLYEASRLPKKIVEAFGTRGITNEHLQAIVDKVWKYIIIKTIISLCVGFLVWILLTATRVEYAMLWALIAFFLNYIPNIGSIIAAVPGIALALFDHGWGTCVIVSIGYLAINQTLGYYVEPIFLGDGLGISPLVVLLSLIFWGWLLGLIGMFLSAPLTIVLKIIFDSFDETRWVGVLMDK